MKALSVSLGLLVIGGVLWFFTDTRSPGEAPAPRAEAASATRAVSGAPSYETGTASADGIGKYYLGREISKVMGHRGIFWLERSEREQEEAPAAVISSLELAPDACIADIGAGSGYYTFRLAKKLPEARVIAVDIQPEMLDFLRDRADRLGITNVSPHLGKVTGVNLPEKSIDAALLVDAYHEFSHPFEMARSLYRALRPGGRIYLLEYRAEDPEVPIKPLHKMTEKQAIREWQAAGFQWVKTADHLPWQHLLIFKRPAQEKRRVKE